MNNPSQDPQPSSAPAPSSAVPPGRGGWFAAYPWLPFALPLVVYMAVQTLEPTPDEKPNMLGIVVPYFAYPLIYSIKVTLALVALAFVWPVYRQFSWKVSPLAPVVGVVGVVLWIVICALQLELRLLEPLGLSSVLGLGARSALDPLTLWPEHRAWAYGFLAVRFLGLAAVVPIIEEFFLRGLVMRYPIEFEWWRVPIGAVTPAALIAGTLLPILMHPGEIFAAAVWFTLVTWLVFKTRNIWDAVVAHAVTNLLLGIYVVTTGNWQLW